jgi:DNA polymerase III epsilon subunit family exonuclease
LSRLYVALDIETTGLNADQDEIIEVGAVRFKEDRVFDTFSNLINPGRAIPFKIQQLTGISNDDVAEAPTIEKVLPALSRFVGENPVVGHNIGFDLGFLRRHNILQKNLGVDTFELASILLPHASRYSLSALLKYLDITLPPDGHAHRALDDADATRELFNALLNQARRLDSRVVREVSQISKRTSWPLGIVFNDLGRERRSRPPAGSLGQQLAAKGFMGETHSEGGLALIQLTTGAGFDPPLKPVASPVPLEVEKLCAMLEEDGLFANEFERFEHRPQQVDMLASVIESLNNGQHTMIEAGTGTGKSVAYLIPAIYWAVQNGERVVISTNTINLQDQLLNHDIPMLQKILPITFKAVALKGRSNYVCPRRMQMFQGKSSHSHRELRLLAKLLVWQPSTTTGDREELFMPDYAEQALWGQVASDPTICNGRFCSADSCFYARARREAESAHIIVVNHALLLADIGVDNRVIPEYNYLIVDEAHHLEDAVTSQLSFVIDQKRFAQFLRELSQPLRNSERRAGFIHEIARLSAAVVPDGLKDDINDLAAKADDTIDRLGKYADQMFQALQAYISDFPNSGAYNPRIRLTEPARNRSTWSNVEMEWENVDASLKDASTALGILHTMLTELESYDVPNWEDLLGGLNSYRGQLDEIRGNLKTIITPTANDRICGWNRKRRAEVFRCTTRHCT